MSSEEIKQQVLNWISDGCNYETGVELYRKHGKNVMLKRDFPGHQNRYATKIVYELCKSVGLEYGQLLLNKKIVVAKEMLPSTASRSGSRVDNFPAGEITETPETLDTKNIAEYPPIIRRVITEYAKTFQERSMTQQVMTDMPEGNSQALKTKRAELFDMVKACSTRLAFFFDIRQQFEKNGYVPSEEEIWPKPKEKAKTELPNDIDTLKKMKKNLQSANTKDQSLLDYQSKKQGQVKRPMPAGPKRMKIENRIKARIKMIDEIEYKLLEL